jgi:hypothetical protein
VAENVEKFGGEKARCVIGQNLRRLWISFTIDLDKLAIQPDSIKTHTQS